MKYDFVIQICVIFYHDPFFCQIKTIIAVISDFQKNLFGIPEKQKPEFQNQAERAQRKPRWRLIAISGRILKR
jgi:hypothetical protein